ncbi:Site-specific recombinase [Kingella potus]|uniref:Site-specific recombinase n=1 Tax=Kingella potus TaxID=265175 RepID=A0A377R5R7_9NEIS|nr:recombinase [Kingella potus]UOP00029.1 recombinase [Kingella potus]STR03322.1 Site-specific recombinase [Kingella potus]
MKKITAENLVPLLSSVIPEKDMACILNALVQFLRGGGTKRASQRFDLLLDVLKQNPDLAQAFGGRFHQWLAGIHIYPALVGLGIFSRSGFAREIAIRVYERFMPSFKDLNNLRDVFLYIFRSQNDEKWLQTVSLHQWLSLYEILREHSDPAAVQTASRHLEQARLHALEMLSVWVAAEELEPEFTRIEPKLMEVDSAFVALHQEISRLVSHYRVPEQKEAFDTAHIAVMMEQCRAQVERLRRKGTGAGAGSSVKVAHLLERLSQTLDRIAVLLDIQTAPDEKTCRRHCVSLLNSLTMAAVEQHSTELLRRRSIQMLAKSISENTSGHGEHYITRNRREYFSMLASAAGGGVIIALMAGNKIRISGLGLGDFSTAFLAGLNYGIGFMFIHMVHCTVATKQPAMTAARIAEHVEQNDKARAVESKLARLLIDVARSQTVAVFGNVVVAVIVASLVAVSIAESTGSPMLDEHNAAYQFKSLQPFTQPTLWYAAIAGVWLFCSGIISGFYDNRADYLNLRKRLTVQPLLKRILPLRVRTWLGDYLHRHYGSLAGNFIFGMLLGMTGWFGHLLGLPLDIRHVAFSSANLGYASVSGGSGFFYFLMNLVFVLMIGLVNLIVSFSLALIVALRSRGARIESLSKLTGTLWQQIRANPLNLFFPVPSPPSGAKDGGKAKE